jgi:hypothetical protein
MVFATLLLAASAFLLVLQTTATQTKKGPGRHEVTNQEPIPYLLIAAAFCLAFIALSASSEASHNYLFVYHRDPSSARPTRQRSPSDYSSNGYHFIVLLPIKKGEEKILPSPPLSINASSLKMFKPWIIPFYGTYSYFKSAGESPGPDARNTRGDPLKVNVRSTDQGTLLMEAHQQLTHPLDLTCCREIRVVLRNDIAFGAFAVGLSLTDSHSIPKSIQSLGVKCFASRSTDHLQGNTASIEETLIFPFPKSRTIKQFDSVTVNLSPDTNHLTTGRKVAVERFIMILK